MNCTKESTWFSNLKASLFTFLLIFTFSLTFSQELWKVKIGVDNTINIQNYWSGELEEIRIVVFSDYSKSVYAKDTVIYMDNWLSIHFPEGFDFIYGDSIGLEKASDLTIAIKKKRETVHKEIFTFEPSLNLLLQLDKYDDTNFPDVWGEVIDAFTWEDKKGKNVVVRSYLDKRNIIKTDTLVDRYLYFYHFISDDNDQLKLLRKYTDSFKQCSTNDLTQFKIESIELTDIDRDTIGEISTIYKLGCNSSKNDSVPHTVKVLMSSQGEKYMMSGYVTPLSKKKLIVTPSLNLKRKEYFERFLRKKLLLEL